MVTLALEGDVDAIKGCGHLLMSGYVRMSFERDSCTVHIVRSYFLYRKGNPKKIFRTGVTLLRDDVGVITPNPKTSGGARWNYLAAWALCSEKQGT